jgi:outer membrane receptor protein involved in Fe transport
LFQDTQTDGTNEAMVQPGLGDLEQDRLLGSGKSDRKSQAYGITLTSELRGMTLTSVTGYNVNAYDSNTDFSTIFGGFLESGFGPGTSFEGFGVSGSELINDVETKRFTQEVRLAAPLGDKLDLLTGAFYSDESSRVDQQILSVDPADGAVVGSFLHATWPSTVTEYAAFANFTVHVADRFDVQVGGRESRIRQTYSEIDGGLYGPVFYGAADPLVTPEVRTNEDSFTYLLTPQFKISPDLMAYARVASGYRAGGPNATATLFNLPLQFKPDKTRNYEVGLKGSAFDRTLSFDASAYYIDWKDIQLTVANAQGNYFLNGSHAKSQGVELSVETRPLSGLTIASWVAFNEAELTEDFPDSATIFGESGDRLPGSSRWSGNFSLTQNLPLPGGLSGSVGAAVSYVGDRAGGFKSGAEARQPNLPSYVRIDLLAKVALDSWMVNAFVNNLADKRGIFDVDPFDATTFTYIQPRTVGISVSKSF